ncbi:MAG: tetratricopeptide repeat protein [Methylococcales bacterium]
MPVPATSLDQTCRVCNPDKPLRADETVYYVDLTDGRGIRNIAESITRRIRPSKDEYLKLLLTGHRGSGNSTALLQWQKRLMDEGFFPIYLDVEEQLDLARLYRVQWRLEQALEVARSALAQFEALKDDENITESYLSLGRSALNQRDFAGAEGWYRKSLQITEKHGNEHAAPRTYAQLGKVAHDTLS